MPKRPKQDDDGLYFNKRQALLYNLYIILNTIK